MERKDRHLPFFSARGGAETPILAVALTLAALVGLGGAWWMAQPDHSLTQFERLGAEIGCVCGTCPNRPIATCGCPYADGMLDTLQAAIAEGGDDDGVMTAFVAQYGPTVRIKPASSGLDFTAWAAPILALTLGAVLIAALVVRMTRRPSDGPATAAATTPEAATIDPDSEQAARLRAKVERELEGLEG